MRGPQVDAYIALKKPQGAGGLQYYIHVGSETSQAGLGPVRAQAEAVLGKLSAASAGAYLQLRDDYTISKKSRHSSLPLSDFRGCEGLGVYG